MRDYASALRRAGLGTVLLAASALPGLAAEGKKAGMPQLDPSSFAPQLIWLLISFIVLYLIISKVALPKVADVLEERQNRIADDLDEAEKLKRQTEKAIADYEQALAKARANAQSIGGAARDKANAEAAAERAKADGEITEKVKAAEAAVATARQAALSNLQTVAADATQAVVEHLVAIKIPAEKAAAAVDAVMKGGR